MSEVFSLKDLIKVNTAMKQPFFLNKEEVKKSLQLYHKGRSCEQFQKLLNLSSAVSNLKRGQNLRECFEFILQDNVFPRLGITTGGVGFYSLNLSFEKDNFESLRVHMYDEVLYSDPTYHSHGGTLYSRVLKVGKSSSIIQDLARFEENPDGEYSKQSISAIIEDDGVCVGANFHKIEGDYAITDYQKSTLKAGGRYTIEAGGYHAPLFFPHKTITLVYLSPRENSSFLMVEKNKILPVQSVRQRPDMDEVRSKAKAWLKELIHSFN